MTTTTTANNNENKVLVNRIGFSGLFYKFLREDLKIGNRILYPGNYEFDYLIKLDDECKNGHLTFSFTGSIKIKKGNGRYYDFISGAIGDTIAYFKPELSMFAKLHLCNHLGQPTYIDNIEKRRKCKLKIEGKGRVHKQLPKEDCEVLENLYQLGYASNAQKELRDKARKEGQK